MRRMASLVALVLAPFLVVVSLSMPWQAATCGSAGQTFSGNGGPTAGLTNLFACPSHVDGWSSIGDVAALASLLLAVLAGVLLVRPNLQARLPLGTSALLVAYFTIAVAVETHAQIRQIATQFGQSTEAGDSLHFHFARGAYLSLAAAGVALLGAAVIASGSLTTARPSPRDMTTIVLALCLLASLLLPWNRATIPGSELRRLGLLNPPGVIAAVLATALIPVCWRTKRAGSAQRLALGCGALVFAGAALPLGFGEQHVYGAWLGLASAALLAAVSGRDAAAARTVPRTVYGSAVVVAATAFVTSLFLPWQTACYRTGADLKAFGLSGRCISGNGLGFIGSTSAVLGIMLALSVFVAAELALSKLELAVAFGLLVTTLGFDLETGSETGVRLGVGYGAIVGLLTAALLVVLTLARHPVRRVDLAVTRRTAAPITLAIVYVAAVVVPWWGVLPDSVWSTFLLRLASVSWLTIASALLGIQLIRIWAQQGTRSSDQATELITISLGLVALTVLETLPLPTVQLTWNSGVLLGLAVPLVLLAVIEERGGLRTFRVPEILRIDRI